MEQTDIPGKSRAFYYASKAQGSMRTVPVLIKGIVPVSNKFTIIARLVHY